MLAPMHALMPAPMTAAAAAAVTSTTPQHASGAARTHNTPHAAAQECWTLMFESVDDLHDCVRISAGVLSTLKIRPERMLQVGGCSALARCLRPPARL